MTAEYAVPAENAPKGIAVTRNPLTKGATLAVPVPGKWTLYAGRDAASIDYGRPLAEGNGPCEAALPELPGWMCFALRLGGETTLLAERHLPMSGGYNFRDLGGFPGAGGKRVAWGKFFRTDGLSQLTEGDLAYLASIPVRTVVDFRTVEEAGHHADRIPPSVATVLHLPIAPGYMNPAETRDLEDYESPDDFMLHMYRDLALDPSIAVTYRKFFAAVQAADGAPLIFHCSAGKDRTGVAAAYILSALGVDRETIFRDYESSNAYLRDKYADIVEKKPSLKGLFTVKRPFLAEVFTLLDAEYGSLDTYLETVLDVDIAGMRRRFLV